MPLEARLGLSLAVALTVVYWATPVAIRVADRLQFHDRPVGYKGHARPTPYLGGAAVVLGFLLAAIPLAGDWDRTLPVAGGVLGLWVIGTVDDRRHVAPALRVAAEIALAGMLWAAGLGWDLGAGSAVDLAVTATWIVAVVNAFNLFDNMDGAASTMAGVVSAALALLGAVRGDAWLAAAAAALSGACFGFLPHNLLRSPARIFLGDGGSMPIGFAVAAIAMIGVADASAPWQSLAMGLLFVGVPAIDTTLVVISRTRRGISVLTGGRDHLTHRTGKHLRTARAVALTLGATQAVISVLALIALEAGGAAAAAAVLAYTVAAGVAIAVLDTRMAPEAPAPPAPAERAPVTALAVTHARSAGGGAGVGAGARALVLLVPLALAGGLSPFAGGLYSPGVWVPGGLALIIVATATAIARPERLTRPALVSLGALAALAVWALLSALWASSAQQAVTGANRLLVYAVALGLLLLLVRSERAAKLALATFGAAIAVVALVIVGRMIGGDTGLFLAGRLDRPLGYINGQAALLVLGIWPCVSLAEQRGRPLLAGAGIAAATLFACLALLSQSRGVALSALAGAVLVLLVPGRLRRAWLLVVAGAAVAAAGPALLAVYSDGVDRRLASATVTSAGLAALGAAVASGVVWAGVVALARRPTPGLRRAAAAALAVLAFAGLAATAINAATIRDSLRAQYDAFVHLAVEPDPAATTVGSRLVSGSGNRYDYWRVAWDAWRERPLAGWGAGNYDRPYFAHRRTTEDVRQPHSVQLQTLSELGLVGGLLLLAALGAVAAGAARSARRGSAPLAAAAIGTGGAWLVSSSVDWTHMLPGATLAALIAAAVLLRPLPGGPAAATVRRQGLPRMSVAIAAALVIALAGVSLTRQGMTDLYRNRAEGALAGDPGRALIEADRALRLDGADIGSYYVKSAALARFDRPREATAALREAARRDPDNFVTWALLGDLAVRTGDLASARRDYGRAAALNPRDPQLRAAAADPGASG